VKNLCLLGAILSILAVSSVGCAVGDESSQDSESVETQSHGAALEINTTPAPATVDDSVDPGEDSEAAAGGTPEKPQPDPWRVAILPEKPQPDPWYDQAAGPDKPQPDPWAPGSPEAVASQNTVK
jgi:hypothetical protein